MPKIHPPELEAVVKTLSTDGYTQRGIVNQLKSDKLKVSKTYVHNVLHGKGDKRQSEILGVPPHPKNHPNLKRTKKLISRVKTEVTKENPKSQRAIARVVGTSQHTIRKVIYQDLNKEMRRKTKVHVLKPCHIQNRKTNSRKLYENHLSKTKREYMVTIDEAWVYLDYCQGERKICYVDKGEKIPANWAFHARESYGRRSWWLAF